MHSSHKNTPASVKKNGKEEARGKELLQARLPFKILSGSPLATAEDGSVSSPKLDVPPKKRKLSYTEELENPKKIGKSDVKENVVVDKTGTGDISTAEVICLGDEDSNDSPQVLSPKTPVSTLKNTKSKKKTPRSSGCATPKVQIKLPLSGKKKRKAQRVCIAAKSEASDSSDLELVSEEQQNPLKKTKLSQDGGKHNDDNALQAKSLDNDVADLSENEQVSGVDSKDKPCDIKLANETENNTTPEGSPSCAETTKTNQTAIKYVTPSKDNKIVPKEDLRFSQKEKKASKKSPSKEEKVIVNSTANDSVTVSANSAPSEKKHLRRSSRVSEVDENADANQSLSLEEKIPSEPETISESENMCPADTSISKETKTKLLTPKQLKLMEQRKKAREEKDLKLQQLKEERERKLQEQREERERKLQEEKMQKQKEREERETQRKKEREEKEDQKRREREEKEDQRRKEKEDKERKRLAEIEAKNEEKRKKDEAKEDERRKKEEDRRQKELEKEEEENKKKKAAQAFTKFFVPKATKPSTEDDQESRDDVESVDSLAFMPFRVKGDMKLAPLVRRQFKERSREKLDSFLSNNTAHLSSLYLNALKNGDHIPLRGSKTILKANDDDVIIIENELETAAQAIDEVRPKSIEKYKAKFYFFRENRRPPFYGTWRKKSSVITARRPFSVDKKFFDYEVDSDDEWEDEEPGESLNGSEDEKDESDDEEYEVDNEWFVPHGHLSDEEMQNEDEIGPDTSREAQKAKLKALQQEFAQEMKKKTEKIKPRLIGAIWEDQNGNRPSLCPTIIWDSLCACKMMFNETPLVEEPKVAQPETTSPIIEKQKRLEINDELMSDLVRLVHGNRHSRNFIIKEFVEHVTEVCDAIKTGECLAPTKSLIREKIDDISEWSVVNANSAKKKNKKKLCWVVSADVLDKYSLANLGLRNEWSYKLQPKFDKDINEPTAMNEAQEKTKISEQAQTPKTTEKSKLKSKKGGIKKFAKIITKDEKQNQLEEKSSADSASPKIDIKRSPKVTESKSSPKAKLAEVPIKTVVEKSPLCKSPTKIPLVKKRVALLMSVPRGQEFSPQSKKALINNFLQENATSSTSSIESIPAAVPLTSVLPMDVDELVVTD